jgi:hypothetical protein
MTETRYGLAQLVDHNELELERFVDSFDTILPYFRVRLSGEHLAAWAVHGLRETGGCRCRRLVGDAHGARRVTQNDHKLVFYSSDGLSATLIRGGREHVITFDGFESAEAKAEFIFFIAELMADTAAV